VGQTSATIVVIEPSLPIGSSTTISSSGVMLFASASEYICGRHLHFPNDELSPKLDVGKFVHETADYRITYDVNENHQATFTFWVPSPPGRQPPEEFTHGPYLLSKTDTSTYAVEFDGSRASAHDWYKSIERLLLRNNVIDNDHPERYGGVQPGDLSVLTYTS
ncbi:hypothetical protein FOZ63_010803, partial [Perkinsus olseni]